MRDKAKSVLELPAMDVLAKARLEIEAAKILTKEAREKMYHAILTLPLQIGDNTELRDLAIEHVYWFEEDIPPSWLAEAFGLSTRRVAEIAGEAFVSIECQRCGRPVSVANRTELQELRRRLKRYEGDSSHSEWLVFLCDLCRAIKENESVRESETEYAAREARRRELRTMPYQLYLQTPEWKERRAQHLKSVGYRCQVCDASGVLHVHHRTYERRGNEHFKDLIVLCEECHRLYHEQGKLPMDDSNSERATLITSQ